MEAGYVAHSSIVSTLSSLYSSPVFLTIFFDCLRARLVLRHNSNDDASNHVVESLFYSNPCESLIRNGLGWWERETLLSDRYPKEGVSYDLSGETYDLDSASVF